MPESPASALPEQPWLSTDTHATAILKEFLRFPLTETRAVFERFLQLPGAVIHGSGRERVLYVEGARPSQTGRCLLVAHADTVWDDYWVGATNPAVAAPARDPLVETNGVIRSADPARGLGADDRAGLAILWLLRDLGHSLMVTDLEEQGRMGSSYLRKHELKVLSKINRDHAFAIQFDRRNSRDYKCYDVGNNEFRSYLSDQTGYTEPDRRSFTDICTLCDPHGGGERMCGANLSIGYYEEHSEDEHLVVAEWLHTLNLARHWLSQSFIPHFRR